ncbi:MAG TPA: hypothetical protein VFK78_08235 [Gemmatimonadales bacterium]|nr:hypothetical protein [Gemmatimonadales bacterium]
MRERAVGLLLALAALARPALAQEMPGEQPPPAAFPTSFTAFVFLGSEGRRATRVFIDPLVPGCDVNPCSSDQDLSGAPGLGARFQTSVASRAAFRLGVAIGWTHYKIISANGGSSFSPPDRVRLLRADGVLLFRLKPQVPVYFGLGAAIGEFSPGVVINQPDVTEFGGVVVLGIDHRVSPKIGTRFEWTGYLMKPDLTNYPSEYHAPNLALDMQFSFGLNFFVIR